jgi:rhomboid protease GluP
MAALFFFILPALVVALVIWLTLREKQKFERDLHGSDTASPPCTDSPKVAPSDQRWFMLIDGVKRGPFAVEHLQRFRDHGVVVRETELLGARTGIGERADEIPGLFESIGESQQFASLKVAYQTFLGLRDPIYRGNGTAVIARNHLTLAGKPRRLFAWRRREESIPLASILDVLVDGRVVRFAVEGKAQQRLLNFQTEEEARAFAVGLPARMSEAGQQVKHDTEEFAQFMKGARPWGTFAIIGANFAVYLLVGFSGSGWVLVSPGTLANWGGNLGPITTQGEWWRMLSSNFLHSGLMHVSINMIALWDAGRVTERLFGHARYLSVYLAAGLVASIASINWQQESVSVGASGAVFGIYGVLLAALVLNPLLLPATVTRRLRNGALFFVGYALLQSLGQKGIDHAAHVAGLFSGMLFGSVLVLSRTRAYFAAGVSAILIIVGVWRADVANAPYADERRFWKYLSTVIIEEQRLNERAKQLVPAANSLGSTALAEGIDKEIVPGWKSVSDNLNQMDRLLPRSKALHSPLSRYAQLKYEGFMMFRDSILTSDENLSSLAGERLHEANRQAEAFALLLKERTQNKPAGSAGTGNTTVTPASGQPLKPLPELAASKPIMTGQWRDAGRIIYADAAKASPKGATVAVDQGMAGFVEDMLQSLATVDPAARSWVLRKVALEAKHLEDATRRQLLMQSVESVRQNNVRPGLKSEALAEGAVGLLRLHQSQEMAVEVMREALAVALSVDGQERAVALRSLAEAMDSDSGADVRPLLPIAEEAAQISGDPFHQSFAQVSVARSWHRLKRQDKAILWWQSGRRTAAQLAEPRRRNTAESHLAKVAAEWGDRQLAKEMIDARRGTFVDVLAKDVMVASANRGEYDTAFKEFASLRASCSSNIGSGGFALIDVVKIQVSRGDFEPALRLISEAGGCAPRFVSEAFISIASTAEVKGNGTLASEALKNGVAVLAAIKGRTATKHELLVKLDAATVAARLGDKAKAAALIAEVVADAEKFPPSQSEERIAILAKAAAAYVGTGNERQGGELFLKAYQLAESTPKVPGGDDTGKSRALAAIAGAMLSVIQY